MIGALVCFGLALFNALIALESGPSWWTVLGVGGCAWMGGMCLQIELGARRWRW